MPGRGRTRDLRDSRRGRPRPPAHRARRLLVRARLDGGRRRGVRLRHRPTVRDLAVPVRRASGRRPSAPARARAGARCGVGRRRHRGRRPQHRRPGALEAISRRCRRQVVGRPSWHRPVPADPARPRRQPQQPDVSRRTGVVPLGPRGHRKRVFVHAGGRRHAAPYRPRRHVRAPGRRGRRADRLPTRWRHSPAHPGDRRGRSARGRSADRRHPTPRPARCGRRRPRRSSADRRRRGPHHGDGIRRRAHRPRGAWPRGRIRHDPRRGAGPRAR